MNIRENLHRLLERIETLSGRNPSVKLIAVSKTKPVSDMLEVISAGHLLFGENKIQEAKKKTPLLPDIIDMHFIGSIQSNKIKYLPPLFTTIHSVSSTTALHAIEKHYNNAGKTVNVLIQINLCDENSKSGLTSEEDLFNLLDTFCHSRTVRLTGLMTIPNPTLGETGTGKIFQKLRTLRDECQNKFLIHDTFTELSMGMSADYPIAIREGATYVRIGSAIFGGRDYTNTRTIL